MKEDKNNQDSVTRRNFLKQSSTVVGGSVLGSMALNHGVFAAQNDELKVALIGCGGRGSGAADQALNTHDQGPLKLVAMADAFGDRLEGSLKNLARAKPKKGRKTWSHADPCPCVGATTVLVPVPVPVSAPVPTPAPAPPPPAADAPKPKKICCACPETRKPRDECVVTHGEDKCAAQIEAHKKCLRAEGFDVRAPPCHASHVPCCRLTVPPLARQV